MPHLQSCDECRRRKTKCDRADPTCGKCHASLLPCTYNDHVRRKTPFAAARGNSTQPNAQSRSSHVQHYDHRRIGSDVGTLSGTSASTSPADSTHPTRNARPQSIEASMFQRGHGPLAAEQARVSGQLLRMHVNLFLKWMFPTWPVIRPAQLKADCQNPEALSPQRYCLLLALSAATNIQLNLAPSHSIFDLVGARDMTDAVENPYRRDYLLREAVKSRKELDIATDPDLDTLLTSCFLFSAYTNLEKHHEAWHYLSQTVSFVISLNLHDELTYDSLNVEDAQIRRRIFWLVFVLERAYSLHLRRPVILQNNLKKPDVTFLDDPAPIDGFLDGIRIFECLPAELYNWLSTPHANMMHHADAVPACYWSLSNTMLVPSAATEGELANISITQQWLRSFLWHVALKNHLPDTVFMAPSLPFEVPISAAKSVMSTIASVNQHSMDIHGVGMERKLFDLGTYIIDFGNALPSVMNRAPVMSVNPKELLWGILLSLSKMRGAQSFLLPILLQRSKQFLAIEAPFGNPGAPDIIDDDELPDNTYMSMLGPDIELLRNLT